jgi:hypothetical protein
MEIQVSNSHARNGLSKTGTAGAIYDCLAPAENAVYPPGQWNHCQVTCQDNLITVVLNGADFTMDVDQWTTARQNPDGTPNKFPRAIKDFALKGHVGLQDHGRPVWYRNIRVKRL